MVRMHGGLLYRNKNAHSGQGAVAVYGRQVRVCSVPLFIGSVCTNVALRCVCSREGRTVKEA